MTIKQTSKDAYRDVITGGTAHTQAQKVLQTLHYREGGMSRKELSVSLSLPINAVTGRVAELLAAGQIYVSGTDTCAFTGKTVEILSVNYGTQS
ncbi:MAG: hypothetical protein [Caudoviricetes sp.]|nr:MAG: hypothetical protein [Caudoviricetes sp.]